MCRGCLECIAGQNPVSTRADKLKRRKAELKSNWTGSARNKARKQQQAMTFMKQVTHRLNLLKSEASGRFVDKLARAGWRSREALVVFAFMKICLPFVFGAAAFIIFDLMNVGAFPGTIKMFAPLIGAALGAYAPDIFVNNAASKRAKAIQKGVPDALDLLVICAEAGLSLDAAMTRVAKESEHSCPEIADEFGLTAVELGFLPERRKAIENLNRRCTLPALRGVTNTLLQTEKYGTPLANSLRVLSVEFRGERMMKAEEKAARLPAIMTIPMMLFILPVLFVVLIGPAALKMIDSFSTL